MRIGGNYGVCLGKNEIPAKEQKDYYRKFKNIFKHI